MRQKKPLPNHLQITPPHAIFFPSSILLNYFVHFPTVFKEIFHQTILLPRLLPLTNPARSPEQSKVRFPPHPPSAPFILPGKKKTLVLLPAWLYNAGGGTASPGTRCQQLLPTCQGTEPPGNVTGAGNATVPHPRETWAQQAANTAWLLLKNQINPGRKDPDSRRAPFPAQPSANPVPVAQESLNDFPAAHPCSSRIPEK